MMTELNALAQNLAQTWLAFSVVLAVQLGLVLLLRKPVRAWFGAVACYRLWLLPLLCLPFYLAGPTLVGKLASLQRTAAGTTASTPSDIQLFIDFELLPFSPDTNPLALSASGNPAVNGWLVLTLVWGVGTLALLAWQGRRWLDFSRQVRTLASPLDLPQRKHCGVAAHFSSRVLALSLQGMGSAAVFGVVKPALLLPDSFCRRYDGNQRHIILAHEAVHLRRGDNGWNVCAMLLLALFWTNPLVLLAWRYYRFDQELSCDALALTRCNMEQQKRYARTLLDSLGALSSHATQPALSSWDNLGDIKERSLMIKQHLHTATRPVAMLLSLIALTMLGAALTVTFAELVSPVAQAAESAPRTQAARQAAQVVQLEEQAAQLEAQVAQIEAQASQLEAQAAQVEAQAVQVEAHTAQVEAQAAQVEVQTAQLEAQAPEPVTEAQQEYQAPQPGTQAAPVAQQVRQAPQPSVGGRSRADNRDEEASDASTIDQQTAHILSAAIEFLNNDQFAEARERLGDLRLNRLSPFERSRYEQLMFNLDMHDENFPAARGHLQEALDSGGLNPQETSMMKYQMAQLYVQEKNYAEAAAALEAWIATEPTPNGAAYYLLGASYYYLHQIDRALPNAEKAVELGKSSNMHVEAHYAMLAALYEEVGQAAAAESVRAEMAALFPPEEAYREPRPPQPLVRVNPDYPQRALTRGIEGWVNVEFTIDPTGAVRDPIVLASSPKKVFDDAAIDAVSRWQYNSTREGELPVQFTGMRTKIRFALVDI